MTDDTVRLAKPPRKNDPNRILLCAIAVLTAIALGLGWWFVSRPSPDPVAGERAIFRHVDRRFTVFRFRDDKFILVVDCPDLHAQGLMFDRVAALVEKADAPKNRVLDATEFRSRLTAADLTVGDYYYGNDYPATALRRFFRLVADEHLSLNPEEIRLRRIARRSGFLRPGANGAIISIPQAGTSHRVNRQARAVILRHELSHGAYFTIPVYHRYVHRFYDTVMTPQQRADFRTFLVRQGYDAGDHDLIVNETIAYLIFTRDRAFFRASAVGLPQATIASLRDGFIAHMPDIWLKSLATAPLPTAR